MSELHILLQTQPYILLLLTALFGLCAGSLLNVIVYRLPIMMQRQWRAECLQYLALPEESAQTGEAQVNLFTPRSHCPYCKRTLAIWQNIPLLSYCLLRGRCAYCAKHISIRYPLLELFTATLSVFVVWMFAYSWESLYVLIFTWSLLCLTCIDLDHHMLPDVITLPLLWLGLLLSTVNIFTNSHDAIIGAVVAYASLWLFVKLFKCLTGKDGMGHGDFKLFAVFGAWLGWQVLPFIIIFAAVTGAIAGIIFLLCTRQGRNTPIPFGPYLAISGWLAMFWGQDITNFYIAIAGL